MLKSVGLELPHKLVVHPFVTDKEGVKMSKSLGNVIDPFDLLERFHDSYGSPDIYGSPDLIRYYIASQSNLSTDFRFNEEGIMQANDNELLQRVGNLVARTCSLVSKYCDGSIPEIEDISAAQLDQSEDRIDDVSGAELDRRSNHNLECLFNIAELEQQLDDCMKNLNVSQYLLLLNEKFKILNLFVNETHVWTIGKGSDHRSDQDRRWIIRKLVDGLCVVARYFSVICPMIGNLIRSNFDLMEDQLIPRGGESVKNCRLKLFKILNVSKFNDRLKRNMKKRDVKK
jgi:methionyl-tRNA synthetase